MDQESDLLDAREASEFLKLNEQTVRKLARDGQIPAFKLGGSWRFSPSRLEAYLSEGKFPGPKPASSERHILLIDDDPRILKSMGGLLRDEGHRVSTCPNGSRIEEVMSGETPDVIFLDLQMPIMDGAESLEKIRSLWGSVPVVLLTGYPESELMARAMRHGPFTLMKKPPNLDTVLDLAARAF